jgi:hypothetical protein
VGGGQDEEAGLGSDRPQSNALRLDRREDESYIRASIQQPRRRAGDIESSHANLDEWMSLLKALQQARRQPTPHAQHANAKPDRQATSDRPGSITGRRGGAVQHPERLTGTIAKDPTSRRECNTAAVALQQLSPQRRLQLTDLGAENLLCDVDPAGGGSKTGLLSNRHEVAEMAYLDVHHRRC